MIRAVQRWSAQQKRINAPDSQQLQARTTKADTGSAVLLFTSPRSAVSKNKKLQFLLARHAFAKTFGIAFAKAASRLKALWKGRSLMGSPYLHTFKPAKGPEVVCKVVVRDVIVRHREITLDTPVRPPGVTNDYTLG